MITHAIKTERVLPGSTDLIPLLDKSLKNLREGSVLAITSKIVSLCENRVIAKGKADKDELVRQEADLYLPRSTSKYGHSFTVTKHTLISMAGIDESNGADCYILWPVDPQRTANEVREYLVKRFKLKKAGVVITDSTCMPFRLGTTGIVLAHSGFRALKDYVGKPDLFGKPFLVSRASIAGGLAASAVLAMGEGTEQTPLCVIEDLPFVEFQPRNPNAKELKEMYIPIEDDLFEPFLKSVPWQEGKKY